MPNVVEGLMGRAAPIGHARIAAGYVSRSRPAPRGFDDPIWVIVPAHSVDRPYGPCAWPAIHGNTIPTQGTDVWLGFDNDGTPIVLSWAGTHS